MSVEEQNMELMQTLEDAWNAQDVEVFRQRHKPDVVVRWPGQPEPTRGIEDPHQGVEVVLGGLPRPASRQPTLQGLLRLRGLNLLDRPLHRHDERLFSNRYESSRVSTNVSAVSGPTPSTCRRGSVSG